MVGLAPRGRCSGSLRALQILKTEVDRVLALLGCNSIDELGPHFVGGARSDPEQRPLGAKPTIVRLGGGERQAP